jgi:hypothetical protein
MTEAAIAAKLIEALASAADREAGGATGLVSVTIDVLAEQPDAVIETTLVRKTRTLVFMTAEVRSSAGARVITASSVHKVLSA